MLTLVPPSRLGSHLAFAVIDMKSSNVFLSTFSPVVSPWSTSFQHSSLFILCAFRVWECRENRLHPQSFSGLGSKAPRRGWGQLENGGAGRASRQLSSEWHFSLPPCCCLRLPPFLASVLQSIQASISLCIFYSWSLLRFRWFPRIHWTNSEKYKLVKIGAS